MAYHSYLKDYELLTDDVLERLIGEKVDVTHGGITSAGVIVVDVSKRFLWVRWEQLHKEPRRIKLEDIVSLHYDEKICHSYRNPNIEVEDFEVEEGE